MFNKGIILLVLLSTFSCSGCKKEDHKNNAKKEYFPFNNDININIFPIDISLEQARDPKFWETYTIEDNLFGEKIMIISSSL